MVDNFRSRATGLDAPASRGIAVTPNDATDISEVSRGIWVGAGGDLSVVFVDGGAPIVLSAVASGTLLPVRVSRVMATGTTASAIVALA